MLPQVAHWYHDTSFNLADTEVIWQTPYTIQNADKNCP